MAGGSSAIKGITGLVGNLANLFSSGGANTAGLSDQEAALMEYQRQQNILKNNSFAASTGTGMGTGVSFEDASAGIGAAMSGAGIVDKQAQANLAAQQTSLQALANSAGFGTQSSNVNPTPNVSTGSNTGSSGGGSSPADQLAAGTIPV